LEYFVIGERELVLGFMLAGVEGQAVNNRQEALEAFNKVTGQSISKDISVNQSKPKVLILTEDVYDMLSEEVMAYQLKCTYPLIVEVPGLGGHIKGRKTLTDNIREAIGIQV